MLRSMGSQRVGHDLATEQQQCRREVLRDWCVLLLQTPGPTPGRMATVYGVGEGHKPFPAQACRLVDT